MLQDLPCGMCTCHSLLLLSVSSFQGYDHDVVMLRKKSADSPFDWWVIETVALAMSLVMI